MDKKEKNARKIKKFDRPLFLKYCQRQKMNFSMKEWMGEEKKHSALSLIFSFPVLSELMLCLSTKSI